MARGTALSWMVRMRLPMLALRLTASPQLAFVDATACAGPSVVEWNATVGVNGTVVFKVAGNAPPEAMGWCADYLRSGKQVRSGVG